MLLIYNNNYFYILVKYKKYKNYFYLLKDKNAN